MSEQTIAQLAEKPPLYWEAVAYCEERGIPREEVDKVRTMLAVQEFMRRIEPYNRQVVNLMHLTPVTWIVSDGYARPDTSLEMDKALKSFQELIDLEAEKLGLTVPIR